MRFRVFCSSWFMRRHHPDAPVDGAIQGELADEGYDRDSYAWYVDLATLDDLIALRKSVRRELIIDVEGGEPTIEIYDNYREG